MSVEPLFSTLPGIFGRLAQSLPGYETRTQQYDLAVQIERAFKRGDIGLFEAGTGTGKSFAALIPALLSKKKVVISTNTISLQEQYLYKDIPALKEIYPEPFEAALIKGRGNYLGLRRFDEHLLEQEMDEKLVDWVHNTADGDISELDFVPHFETWNEINSDSDDCLRNKCPSFADCFYFEAKKRAERADILIVNHALLLADAASDGNILPKYDLLIVDEAHHLPEVATDSFSLSISNRGVRALVGKAVKRVSAPSNMVHDVEFEAQEFFQSIANDTTAAKTRIRSGIEGATHLSLALGRLRKWLEDQTFEHLMDVGSARDRAKLKAKSLISTISAYTNCLELIAKPDPSWVLWIERGDYTGSRIRITAAPLNVAPFIRTHLLEKENLHSSVWMSATLAAAGADPFAFFKRNIGVEGHVIQSKISSPFDYGRQSLLYLPRNMPEPNDQAFIGKAMQEIERILDVSDGRAFVLFTSRQALNTVYDGISHTLAFPCRKQGDMPRQKLIEWFVDTPNAVLFGTSSFWEGVSIDGKKLSCVIIDRIPFQVPDDPVHEARCDALKLDQSASWFNDLSLPYAIMRLKQGVGRLIRTNLDTGMVAILDPRLTTKRYGRQILECLPPMTIIRSLSGMSSIDARLSQVHEDPLFAPPAQPLSVESQPQ